MRNVPLVGFTSTVNGLSLQSVNGDGMRNGGISIGVESIGLLHMGHFTGNSRHVMFVPVT